MYKESYNPLLRDDTQKFITDLDDTYGTWFFYLFNLDDRFKPNSYNLIVKSYIFLTTEVIYHNKLYHINTLYDLGVKGLSSCIMYGYATRNAGIIYPLMDETYFTDCKIIR